MRVALFATCVVDQVVPEVGLAVLECLEKLGAPAVFPPGQTCCGQPFFTTGHRDQARQLARATLAVLAPFDAVVIPSGSCAAMITVHYRELFAADDPIQAEVGAVAARTYEFSDFVVRKLGVSRLESEFPHQVTVHDGCHGQRELGLGGAARTLLGGVAGCRVAELADGHQCCGFGGAFSVKFDRLSASMGNAKADAIVATGADAVVSCDPSCLLQIRGILEKRGIAVKTFHLAEILAGRAGS